MKKRVFALVLAVLLLALTACGAAEEKGTSLVLEGSVARFKIVERSETGFLGIMQGEREDLYFVSLGDGVCYDEAGNIITTVDLRPGMVVDICWPGMILESWPGQIGGVTALQVVEQQDDLVGLYLQVLHDLWENDPALNHDVTRLGLDFSGLTNLSEGEVRALEYRFSCDVDLFAGMVTGTWQELCDAGLINGEDLYWEDGVFLSVSLTGEGDGKFTFDAEKWRSGTGAIWFSGCKAQREKNGQWSYQPGAFAIS